MTLLQTIESTGRPVGAALFAAAEPEHELSVRSASGGLMESIGMYLKRERESRGIALDEVADTTRIPVRQLERLEDGRHAELAGEVFVKGYLRAYARALGLKQDDVLGRYANSLRVRDVTLVPVRVTNAPPERGKRFGLAIALVVFAILATLAMSFLLRPRTQERPEQLSDAAGVAASATLRA